MFSPVHAVGVAAVSSLLCAGVAAAQSPTKPGIYKSALETSNGLKLRFTLSIPRGYSPKKPTPLVLSLHHGFDRSSPYPEYFGRGMLLSLVEPGLEKLGAVIVAPDSHGKSWSDEAIEASVVELVTRLQGVYSIDPKRVVVVGFSMGGRGTWEYAARHPQLFTAAIPIASRVELETAEKIQAPIFAIQSRDDGRIPIEPIEAVVQTLERMGRTVKLLTVSGLRHHETPRFREPLERAVPWLEEAWN